MSRITGMCKYKQVKHCTKIGLKCVEERFWSPNDTCLIKEFDTEWPRTPPPPPFKPAKEDK